MPTLHNPTANSIACYLLGRVLGPDEKVEITDEEADALEAGAVFVVDRSKRSAAAEESSDAPKRETVKRG